MRRRSAVRVRAALCQRFNIAWQDYGRLTVREHSVLTEILHEEAEAVRQAESGSH